jgi:hypothetical protein
VYGRDGDIFALCDHQYVDGHGADPGCWRALAAGLLRGNSDDDDHDRLWPGDVGAHPPGHRRIEALWRLLVRPPVVDRLLDKRAGV